MARSHLFVALTVSVIFVVSANAWSQVVFTTDFETNPDADGWRSAPDDANNAWTTDEALSGTHSLRVASGEWWGPVLPAPDWNLFSLTFCAKGQPGQVQARWYGNRVHDIAGSSEWVEHTIVSRYPMIWLISKVDSVFYVDDVRIEAINNEQADQVFKDLLANVATYDFAANLSDDRHQYIPATIAKLVAGGEFKIVMLGDSIVNDTCYSFFDIHLERMYPGSDVTLIPSIRGSTGCWWYKEEDRVQSYVLDHEPDLVMIGGISQFGDVNSIGEVIEQIRAGDPGIEIVLMSEAVGGHDPAAHPEDLLPINPTGSSYRDKLWRLAMDKQVGFVDMTLPWAEFINNSGMEYDEFLRDPVHANYLGTVILGMTLRSYFAPIPEPIAGDLDYDGYCNINDLNMVLTDWGKSGVNIGDPRADANGDGTVDIVDLNTVLIDWGKGTPPTP